MTDRLTDLRRTMQHHGVDLVVLGPGAHLGWLLDVHPHADERPLLFCISLSGSGFLMPALEADSARQHTDQPFHTWADEEGPQAALEALLTAIGADNARSIAIDETMRADFAALVTDNLLNATRQFTASTVGALRMRKSADEYDRLKINAATADTAMRAAWAAMRPGMTEWEVAQIVRDSFADQGVKPMFNIIGTGPNGAFPHHQTGDAVLRPGDAVVMEIGGTTRGMFSDITRIRSMIRTVILLAGLLPGIVSAQQVDDYFRQNLVPPPLDQNASHPLPVARLFSTRGRRSIQQQQQQVVPTTTGRAQTSGNDGSGPTRTTHGHDRLLSDPFERGRDSP